MSRVEFDQAKLTTLVSHPRHPRAGGHPAECNKHAKNISPTLDNIPSLYHLMLMDIAPIIQHQHTALIRIVAALMTMVGLQNECRADRIVDTVYRAVLRVLRPAESAVRRLVVVVAQGMEAPPVAHPKPARTTTRKPRTPRPYSARVSFRLIDPRMRLNLFGLKRKTGGSKARIRSVDFDPRIPLFIPKSELTETVPDTTQRAEPLYRRLAAIKTALDDLPAQARRYLRWSAKPYEQRKPRLMSPFRPGSPPGFRKRSTHEIDEVLKDCQWLARTVTRANTS
jgi:hypothetical protein